MAFSPDGSLLASAGGRAFARSDVNPAHGDTAISLWDVATGTLLRRLVGHGNRVNALAFNSDGSVLVSGSGGNSTSAGLPSFVDPSSTFLSSPSDENSVRVWNTATGVQIRAFTGLRWRVNAVAITPDGRYVAAGSQDNTIRLWDTDDGSLATQLFDPSALEPDRTANYVGLVLASGQPAQRAYPAAAALPDGASCTCNCVAGSYAPKPPADGGICSLVCVCVPVTFPG
jgi:WD40 repeat protein